MNIQLTIFSAEAIIIALLLLFLFRMRSRFGLSPLYITLGVFQPIQAILASTVYVEILPGVIVSPGSVIMFTASLFVILLVYIFEDALETRKAIYGIMAANLTMTLLLFTFGIQLGLLNAVNFLNLSREILNQNARIMLTGTIILFADSVLLILAYETIWRLITKNLFLRIYLTIALILTFDSLAFTTAVFYERPNYVTILISAIIGKLVMAAFYALALTAYLRFAETTNHKTQPFQDIFHILSYRQKFEIEHQRGQQTESLLLESEGRYQTLARISPVGIFRTDANGITTYVNPKWCEISRISFDHALGNGWLDAVHPDDKERVSKGWQESTQLKKESSADYRFLRPDGTIAWVMGRAVPEMNSENQIVGYIGTITDITERKQAEEELHISLEKYRVLFESFPIGITITDKSGRIIEANRESERLLGVSPDKQLGRAYDSKDWQIVRTDGTSMPAAEFAGARALQENRLIENVEMGIVRDNGKITWISVTAAPIPLAEYGVAIAYGDITERKSAETELRISEQKFSKAFRSSPDAVTLTELESGCLVEVNDGFQEVFGYSREEAIGRTSVELGLYNNPADRKKMIQTLHEQGSVHNLELPGRRKSGAELTALLSVEQIEISGKPYLVTVTRDITERKRVEEQVQKQLQRLEALHRIDIAITAGLEMNVNLGLLLEQLISILAVDAVVILLLEPHTLLLRYAVSRGFRTNAIRHTQLPLGSGHAGRAALERRVIYVHDLADNLDELSQALRTAGESFRSYFAVPLIVKGQVKGVLEIFHHSFLDPDQDWVNFMETMANQAAITIEDAQLFNELQRSNLELAMSYDATIEGWSRALDLRDKETEGHTKRVIEKTLKLARIMGLPEGELIHMRRGALLHDIGKIGVPDGILLKAGFLTDNEWEIMRKHPILAYEMLSPIRYLKSASIDIPYCHHEKWDGTGYPRGLRGEQIPIAARIFAVVDVWDAITSDRPYRSAWTKKKAMEYIRKQSEKQFDPQVVDAFLKLVT